MAKYTVYRKYSSISNARESKAMSSPQRLGEYEAKSGREAIEQAARRFKLSKIVLVAWLPGKAKSKKK